MVSARTQQISDEERLARLGERAAAVVAARKALVAEVINAFDQGLSAHRIGNALGITEAGARMIYKRRK